ncbi:fibulin-2-like [Rhopilema esculentum]|uniref:fibulin-2-like n=1 Tax=Rhopilema esculentum TaxID=499914 RepID=UPI0031D6F7B5
MFLFKAFLNLTWLSLWYNFSVVNADSVLSLARCCNEGKRSAKLVSGQTSCLKKPVAFSQPSKLCLSMYKVCCLAKERDQECINGENLSRATLRSEFSCTKFAHKNTLHGSSFLECCECCQLGKIAANKNKTCSNDDIPFNGTCGGIYKRCCKVTRKDIENSGPTLCKYAKCQQECLQTKSGPICSCRKGFRLANDSKSCQDIDECKKGTHQCISGWECKNLIGAYRCLRNFVSSRKCRRGYRIENGICRDIDECTSGIAKCAKGTVCENVLGGHLCTQKLVGQKCARGYYISGARCIDVNECKMPKLCGKGQRCVNTYGSYHCASAIKNCRKGYQWSNSSMACLDENECVTGSHNCQSEGESCRNTHGSYRCFCSRGFFRTNGKCEDRDECTLYKGRLCNHKCTNLPGSYRCDCLSGFELARNKRTCLDINECSKDNVCATGESCFNMPGTYKCIQTGCPRNYLQKTSRSCKLECPLGLDCSAMPVSIKWFTVSRRGPVRQFGFRLIYDVDVSTIFDVRRVEFKFTKGNEKSLFGLQKYGFSKVIIYNKVPLDTTKYYHLKVIGTAVQGLGRRISFEYNLHSFIYVLN